MIRNILKIKCSNCGKLLTTLDTYKDLEDITKMEKHENELLMFPLYCQECYEKGAAL